MTDLFKPYELKALVLKNRIVMPPMCQYAVHKQDGIPDDWHFVHYVSRAVGGTGFIIVEMSGVHPDGRITNHDTGIWSDDQIAAYRKITDGVHAYGAKIAIQLGHAGRKALDAEPPLLRRQFRSMRSPKHLRPSLKKRSQSLSWLTVRARAGQWKPF